jgi:hypothetical protein
MAAPDATVPDATDDALPPGAPTATTPPARARKPAKNAGAKGAGGKHKAKDGKAKTAKTKAAGTGAGKRRDSTRKDAPREGDLTGPVLASYERVLAAMPKAKKEAMNANAIARKLSDEAGKTVWPVPTKKHLETGVLRGDVVKVTDGSRVVYHLK